MSIDIDDLPDEAQKALEQFKEFQIADFNDSGANGYVMIGRHKVLRKDVAIKIYFHEENEVDQEPAIIASINHENVLKVYDARKVEESCSFFMMQAANDGDLYNFLERYDLSLDLSHKFLCQLLSGLSALHCVEKQLVHRDLKPENLLIHDDTLVIADFGSVRKFDNETGQAPASKHSILYRPPEAFGDDAFFDCSSDVYQAGIIGYILMGGELSNDLTTYLTSSELKKFENIKSSGDDYDISVFIDSCLEKRITKSKLLNWNSLPVYVPVKIIRILKRAVAPHGKRYNSVSVFLSELSQAKINLPNWITEGEDLFLRNWKGNDYMLTEVGDKIKLKKKRTSSANYRTDTSISANCFSDAFDMLKKSLKLP